MNINKNKKYLAVVCGFNNPQRYCRSLRAAKVWLKKQVTDTASAVSVNGVTILATHTIHLRSRPSYRNGFSAGKLVAAWKGCKTQYFQ